MDVAQSFGASSSYARKYALSGLFLLDDTKDADATNTHGKEAAKAEIDPEILEQLELINDKDALGKYYKQIQKGGFMTEAIKTEFTKKAATL
jgi:aminoglycoside N3'-acetyltransferase